MSKKKRAALLGPDGRPYVAPKPAPRVMVAGVDVSADVKGISFSVSNHIASNYLNGAMLGHLLVGSSHPKARTLSDAVADEVAAITADFDGKGEAELPTPERDLHTYRDAYASAAAKCLHDDAIELLYGRQWVCDACGRTLNRDDMRRAQAKRGIWGYFR